MLILKPHLMLTMTVVGISSPEWRVIVAFPPILLNRKPPFAWNYLQNLRQFFCARSYRPSVPDFEEAIHASI